MLQIECIDLAFNFLSAVAGPGLCKTAQESAGGVGGGRQILANCQFIQQPTEQEHLDSISFNPGSLMGWFLLSLADGMLVCVGRLSSGVLGSEQS